jgi:hypothetical protein
MTTCKTPLLVSLLAKPQELPVSQLATHVNPFHLVITDNQGPVAWLFSGKNTLPLLQCIPSYKALYPLQLSCCTPNLRNSLAVCASNKSFFSTHGVVFIGQFLTSGAETWERLTRRSSTGMVPQLSFPAFSWTQTAELTPCVYGLWILDLTALLAFPSITSLSSSALHLTYSSPQTW